MTPRRQLLAISMIAAVLLGVGCAPMPAQEVREPKAQPAVGAADVAQRIHKLVNAERRKHGLPALAWDARLAEIASHHSRDMAQRNYLGHDSPAGHDLMHRYKQADYNCEVRVGRVIHTGAENVANGIEARAARQGCRACGLALGRLYSSVTRRSGVATYDWNSPQAIARLTVEGWMKSPGHRENILTPHWTREGIGVEIAPDNQVLVTQNFC